MLWMGAVVAGNYLLWPYDEANLLVLISLLPTMILAVQFPSWCLRYWFAWRVEVRETRSDSNEERPGGRESNHAQPLRIRDVMIATGAIAVAFAAAKTGYDHEDGFGGIFIVILCIWFAALATLGTLSVPICLWSGLNRANPSSAMGIAAGLHVAIVIIGLMVLSGIVGETPPAEAFGYILLGTAGYFTLAIVPIHLAGRYGYRLLIGRQATMAEVQDSPPADEEPLATINEP